MRCTGECRPQWRWRGLSKHAWRLGRAIGLTMFLVLPCRRVMAQTADSAPTTQSFSQLLQGESGGSRRHAAREAVSALTGGTMRPGMNGLTWRPQVTMATLIALTGALLLALPPLAVYRLTTAADRFDPALAESLFILPVAVAGIVTVIQGSLAVALSLAGVVTTVRFRSALRETNDAAYIFLAVAIGVAAGASALDIGAVLALFFCAAMLLLWATRRYVARRYPLAAPPPRGKHKHGGGTVATASDAMSAAGEDHHALITVHAQQKDAAQRLVEPLLDERTKSWVLQRAAIESNGSTSLTYSVHLRKHVSAAVVASAIQEAGAHDGMTVTPGAADGAPTVPAVPSPDGVAAGALGSAAPAGVARPGSRN
jgi:Domain of unknown function (DUF4956)